VRASVKAQLNHCIERTSSGLWPASAAHAKQQVAVSIFSWLKKILARPPEPVGVQAIPVDEKGLEQRRVPESDRLASKYDGLSLSLHIAQLNKEFQLVVQED